MFGSFRRTLAAAGLALALWFVPGSASAADILCVTGESCSAFFSDAEPVNVYRYTAYNFIVGFDDILSTGFDLAITAIEYSPTDPAFASRLPAGFECVPLTGAMCVEFVAETDAVAGEDWAVNTAPGRPGINIGIEWFVDTNPAHPAPRMLHDPDEPGVFSDDITVIYCPDDGFTNDDGGSCTMDFFDAPPGEFFVDVDPGEGGRTDDFSSFTIASPVPEPGTMVLMSLGIAALYRRRARRV